MITKKNILQLKKVAPRKGSFPIIEKTVLIDNCYLTSTDLETFIKIPHDYNVTGAGVISIDILESVFNNIDSITFEGEKCYIKTQTSNVIEIACMSSFDFPDSYTLSLDNEMHNVDAGKLLSVVDFVSKDDLRPAMLGVFLGKHVVATNGHFLKWIESGYNGSEIIIPALAVRVLEDATYFVKHDKKNIIFTNKTNGTHVATRLINERYPNYLQVIPQDNAGVVTLSKKDLQSALKQLKPIMNKTSKQIVLTVTGDSLNVYAENIDDGYCLNVPINANVKHVESGYKIGFNLGYLETVTSNVTSDTVTFNFAEHNRRAGIINGDTLLMPVILGGY